MSQQDDLSIDPLIEQEPVPLAEEPEPALYTPPPVVEKPFSINSFVIEDSFYRSRLPRPVHWSISWSDLMMTMFVLFLSMFVYQASHEKFLMSDEPEIVGGRTSDALDIMGNNNIIVPIVPLAPKAPIRSDSLGKVQGIDIEDLNIDEMFRGNVIFVEPSGDTKKDAIDATAPDGAEKKQQEISVEKDVVEPAPLSTSEQAPPEIRQTDKLSEMYDISKQVLSDEKLDKFASIDLIPDKTMRIILTGDLLFFTGQADLSNKARKSLTELAAVIKNTPYMINVIGHTDNQPMHSSRFATNWELSVVRASSVARFLIDEMGMNPHQFIVSGFGSNRPRKPNTNVLNRAANRRVEIIISKRLPPAVKATSENLL
ncbi:MAG TPA: hypothetical protein EYP35_05100 [Desulfobacterales bacterium]|nr:hypothetical protein [Desulfobacterales bacterium]HIP40048.1 hypothetical protein [Desulfocapsa sulfexigens]